MEKTVGAQQSAQILIHAPLGMKSPHPSTDEGDPGEWEKQWVKNGRGRNRRGREENRGEEERARGGGEALPPKGKP